MLYFQHDMEPRWAYVAIVWRNRCERAESSRAPLSVSDCEDRPLAPVPFDVPDAGPGLSVRAFRIGDATSPVTASLDTAEDEAEVGFGYPVRRDEQHTQTLDLFRKEKVKLFAPLSLAGHATLVAKLWFRGADGKIVDTAEKTIECQAADPDDPRGFLKFGVPDGAVSCDAVWRCDRNVVLARLPVFLVNYHSFYARLKCPALSVPVLEFSGTAKDEQFGRTIAVRFRNGDRVLTGRIHGYCESPEEGWLQKADALKVKDGIATENTAIPVPYAASEVEIRVTLNPKARFEDAPSITMRSSARRMTAVSIGDETFQAPDVLISTTAGPFRDDILRLRSHFIAELFAARGLSTQYVALAGDVGTQAPAPGLRQLPKREFDKAVWQAAASGRPGIYICSSLCDAAAVMAIDNLKRKGWFIVYEVRDDMEAMRRAGFSRWYSPEFEKRICQRADLVICVSQPIREKMLAFGAVSDRTIVIPNGISRSELAQAERNWRSADRAGRTRAGYFGHMFPGRFDVATMRRCALRLPEIEFDLVGPGLLDPSVLELPNITHHGQVKPAEFFRIAQRWDVGILPFQPNRLTYALDPIKHYQYLAAGLKVVSSEVASLRGRPMTRICVSNIDFPDAVAEELSRKPSEKECREVLDFLKTSVWEKRFEDTFAAIKRARSPERELA